MKTPSLVHRPSLAWVALALILAASVALRTHSLDAQGFGYWDEAQYGLEGQFLADTLQRLLGVHPDPGLAPAGSSPFMLKPVHSLLLALGFLGFGSSDTVALAVSAISGVLTVLVVYLLGRSLYSTATGLVAAAFMASMPLAVAYSRQALAESDSILAFSLTVLAYQRSLQTKAVSGHGRQAVWCLVVTGLLLAIVAATNHRLYVMALVFPLMELSRWTMERRQGLLVSLRRLLAVGYPALLGLAVWFPFFWAIRGFYEGSGLTLASPVWSFEEQLRGYRALTEASWRPTFSLADPAYYPFVLWSLVGPGFVLLPILSGWYLAHDRQGRAQNLLLAIWLLVPLVFYGAATDKAPRCIAVILPAIALLAARGLLLVVKRLSACPPPRPTIGTWAGVAAATVMVAGGSIQSWEMAQLQGGYRAATSYLLDHDITKVIAGQKPNVSFYSRNGVESIDVPDDLAQLRRDYDAGYRYALIDDQAYLAPRHRLVAGAMEAQLRPIAAFPDTLKQPPLFHLEHSEWVKIDLEPTLELYRAIRAERGLSEVRIYDLEGYFR